MPPKVIIVEPRNSKEEEKRILDNIAFIMGKMVSKQYGIEIKYKLERISD